jgi:hypothetical protein
VTVTQSQADSDLAIQAQLLALRPGQAVEFGGVTAASVLVGWDVAGVVYTSAGEAAREVLRLRDTGAAV